MNLNIIKYRFICIFNFVLVYSCITYIFICIQKNKTSSWSHKRIRCKRWHEPIAYLCLVQPSPFITPYLREMKSPKTNFVVLEPVKRLDRSEFLRGYGPSGGTVPATRPSFIHGLMSEQQWLKYIYPMLIQDNDNNVEIYGWMILPGDVLLWRLIYPLILSYNTWNRNEWNFS